MYEYVFVYPGWGAWPPAYPLYIYTVCTFVQCVRLYRLYIHTVTLQRCKMVQWFPTLQRVKVCNVSRGTLARYQRYQWVSLYSKEL